MIALIRLLLSEKYVNVFNIGVLLYPIKTPK